MRRRRKSTIEEYVVKKSPEDCWLWKGSLDDDGYPHAMNGHKHIRVHVWMYEKYIGSIPEGHMLHHTCRVKHCANPYHLVPKIHLDHAKEHSPTHCIHGHKFTEENTYLYTRADGSKYRQCKECTRLRANTVGKIKRAVSRMGSWTDQKL